MNLDYTLNRLKEYTGLTNPTTDDLILLKRALLSALSVLDTSFDIKIMKTIKKERLNIIIESSKIVFNSSNIYDVKEIYNLTLNETIDINKASKASVKSYYFNQGNGNIVNINVKDTTTQTYRLTCEGEDSNGNNTWEVISSIHGKMDDATSDKDYVSDYIDFKIVESGFKFKSGDKLFIIVTHDIIYNNQNVVILKDVILSPNEYLIEVIYGYDFDEVIPEELMSIILAFAGYYYTLLADGDLAGVYSKNSIGETQKLEEKPIPVHLEAMIQSKKVYKL